MRRAFLLLAMLTLALAAPAAARECVPTTSEPEAAAGGFYVDTYTCQPDCYPNLAIWIYEESNGIEGLQRNDEIKDDTCGGRIEADTLVF